MHEIAKFMTSMHAFHLFGFRDYIKLTKPHALQLRRNAACKHVKVNAPLPINIDDLFLKLLILMTYFYRLFCISVGS
jgi:hypothetical protein